MSITDEIKTAARKYHAKPHTDWRDRLRDYSHLLDDEQSKQLDHIRDVVYGIVLDTGADIRTISKYFGWDFEVAKALLQPTYETAKAELKLTVLAHLLEFDFSTKQAMAKFHLGRNYADQTESGQPAPDIDAATTGLFNNLTVVETHRDQSGQTVEEPTKLKLVKTG